MGADLSTKVSRSQARISSTARTYGPISQQISMRRAIRSCADCWASHEDTAARSLPAARDSNSNMGASSIDV